MSVQAGEPPRGATFEEVWAMFQENARQLEKMSAETDRRIAETEKLIQEAAKWRAKTDKVIGKLGSRLGEVIEHIMSPKLHEKFEKLGFSFNHSSRNHELRDRNKNRLAEVDILLENGECALAVEVKTHLTTKDVKDHVKRMGILRRVADEHNDKRKYLGAVAGAVVDQEVSAYALKNGFYVITPSGETVDIEAPDGFNPRIW
ncbi:MAG: hypothetical protein LBF63_11575 [Treponema sp.]|nr:hypothetical protein [Treponema sp.]